MQRRRKPRWQRRKPRWQIPFPYAELIWTATTSFIERGYHLTHMDDIAREIEVAKGTIYLYVESKEALFYHSLRVADRHVSGPKIRPRLTPPHDYVRAFAEKRLEEARELPKLNTEEPAPTLGEARARYRDALQQIYKGLRKQKTAIRLIERCAYEHPALAGLALRSTREELPAVGLLSRFLELNRRYVPHDQVIGRLALLTVETLVLHAVYREVDLSQVSHTNALLRDSVVPLLATGVLRRRFRRGRRPRGGRFRRRGWDGALRPRKARRAPESTPIDPPPAPCHT